MLKKIWEIAYWWFLKPFHQNIDISKESKKVNPGPKVLNFFKLMFDLKNACRLPFYFTICLYSISIQFYFQQVSRYLWQDVLCFTLVSQALHVPS